jgi:hypothetical protein
MIREKGDSSKARDFLPADKQYLITRNGSSFFLLWDTRSCSTDVIVPCLRRATAVNYTDADEDAEKLMSFLDEVSDPREMTHTYRSADTPERLKKHRDRMAKSNITTKMIGSLLISDEVRCL